MQLRRSSTETEVSKRAGRLGAAAMRSEIKWIESVHEKDKMTGVRRRGQGASEKGVRWSLGRAEEARGFRYNMIGIGLRWNFNTSDDFGESAQQGSPHAHGPTRK